jgi:hypothetical protein
VAEKLATKGLQPFTQAIPDIFKYQSLAFSDAFVRKHDIKVFSCKG